MFFDFFKKQPEKFEEEEDNDDILASVTYYIKSDKPNPIINIDLKDYDDETINGLCKILDVLSTDASYIETINMIKSALIADNQEELLLRIFTHIGQQAKHKIITAHKESVKDEPCIKPSDMLK
jgi:hypothetical protein